MSRRDDFHYPVRRALEKEGWQITHDPVILTFRNLRLKADLGAERYFAAEKFDRNVIIEVKDFDNASMGSELQKMIGQMQLYEWAIEEQASSHELFLAISKKVYDKHVLDNSTAFHAIVERKKINLIVFDDLQEVITQWIKN
jgi:XisH protein